MKDILLINDETDETCLQSYTRIAEILMNDYKLQVRNKFYRIVECEFYYNSEKHPDPYVHGHQRQKETVGEWYFHGSGLDITLGSKHGYGGILLRGISEVKIESKIPSRGETIIGPLNVVSEIFKVFGDACVNDPINLGFIDISREKQGANMKVARIFSFPRIGLNIGKDASNNFYGKKYRFISFLHLQHKEADKIRRHLLNAEKDAMSLDEYNEYYKGKKWW